MITKEQLEEYQKAYSQGNPLISDENEKEIWKDVSYRDIKPNIYIKYPAMDEYVEKIH